MANVPTLSILANMVVVERLCLCFSLHLWSFPRGFISTTTLETFQPNIRRTVACICPFICLYVAFFFLLFFFSFSGWLIWQYKRSYPYACLLVEKSDLSATLSWLGVPHSVFLGCWGCVGGGGRGTLRTRTTHPLVFPPPPPPPHTHTHTFSALLSSTEKVGHTE